MASASITLYTPFEKLSYLHSRRVRKFLMEQLEEVEGRKADIKRAISYAMKEIPSHGGLVITLGPIQQLKGVAVVNKTGKAGYMAENVLVYLVIHQNVRNQGLGRLLMEAVHDYCQGDIQIQVQGENSAKDFFTKFGYEVTGLEMRHAPS